MGDDAKRISLEPEPGWSPIAPLAAVAATRSFVSGGQAPERLVIRYFLRDRDRALVGKVWFGPFAEGPPGHVHGGAIAAVLDEAMGAAAWMNGHTAVAVQLVTNFRALTPLESVAWIEASVASVDGRKVHTSATLHDSSGAVYAEAEGLFVVLTAERFGDSGDAVLRALREVP